MKNLEHAISKLGTRGYWLCEYAYYAKNNTLCHGCNCTNGCDFFRNSCLLKQALLNEHRGNIELTQFEYDLLDSYPVKEYKFKEYGTISTMHEKGYFKDVDTSMTLKEILDNCEVVE